MSFSVLQAYVVGMWQQRLCKFAYMMNPAGPDQTFSFQNFAALNWIN